MKIAMVGISLYGRGAEYVLATIARGLAARGHEVEVIVSGMNEIEAKDHPEQKPFPVGGLVRVRQLRALRGRCSIFELRRIFARERYEVVVCHAAPFAIPVLLAGLGLKARPKIVYVEHLGRIGTNAFGEKVDIRPSFIQCLKNRLLARYDAIFAVSRGTIEALHRVKSLPHEKMHLVGNPAFDEKEAVIDAEPTHPWLREKSLPVIVAAGGFAPVKNYETLIRAFAEVRNVTPARLVIFGEGELRPVYERLIEELGLTGCVSMPGFTNQLKGELKGADCFVVSSFVESFSLVLVEAMAAGVPVVSTDAPYGPREILKDGRYGILVPNRDCQALARGILRAIRGEGVQPTREMIADYSVEAVSRRYEEILEILL